MNGRFRTMILGAASAALLVSTLASAEKPEEKEKKGKPRQVIDTGVDLMPPDATAEAALERMTSRSTEGLVSVQHPNGMVSMDLEGRFMNVMFATPVADGTAHFSCQTGVHAHKTASAPQTLKAGIARARVQKQLEEK